MAEQPPLALQPDHPGCRARRDDHGIRGVGALARRDDLGIGREVDRVDVVGEERRAEALGLVAEVDHELGTHQALREARVVLDLGGLHQLATGLDALDAQRSQLRARCVDGSRQPGGSAADDDQPMVLGARGHGCILEVVANASAVLVAASRLAAVPRVSRRSLRPGLRRWTAPQRSSGATAPHVALLLATGTRKLGQPPRRHRPQPRASSWRSEGAGRPRIRASHDKMRGRGTPSPGVRPDPRCDGSPHLALPVDPPKFPGLGCHVGSSADPLAGAAAPECVVVTPASARAARAGRSSCPRRCAAGWRTHVQPAASTLPTGPPCAGSRPGSLPGAPPPVALSSDPPSCSIRAWIAWTRPASACDIAV